MTTTTFRHDLPNRRDFRIFRAFEGHHDLLLQREGESPVTRWDTRRPQRDGLPASAPAQDSPAAVPQRRPGR
jgi:hypothetical protein